MAACRWTKARLRARLALSFVSLFVAGFIVSDLITASGWDWRDWLRELRGRPPEQPDIGEIRDYVEFITVQHEGLDIVTGIRFASSYDRRIVRQWCYAEPTQFAPGGPVYRIDLAGHDAPGTPEPYVLTDELLIPFGLNKAEAHTLFENHCRFRDN